MANHSSTFAWKIPWTEWPGRLQSMGLRRVGHDRATSLSLFTFMHWRKWQPTPVFLPGESQGRRSLVGSRLWGRTELTRLGRLSSSTSSNGDLQIIDGTQFNLLRVFKILDSFYLNAVSKLIYHLIFSNVTYLFF